MLHSHTTVTCLDIRLLLHISCGPPGNSRTGAGAWREVNAQTGPLWGDSGLQGWGWRREVNAQAGSFGETPASLGGRHSGKPMGPLCSPCWPASWPAGVGLLCPLVLALT